MGPWLGTTVQSRVAAFEIAEGGNGLAGLSAALAASTMSIAELWGLLDGLREVVVESDSRLITTLVKKPIADCHPLSSLVR